MQLVWPEALMTPTTIFQSNAKYLVCNSKYFSKYYSTMENLSIACIVINCCNVAYNCNVTSLSCQNVVLLTGRAIFISHWTLLKDEIAQVCIRTSVLSNLTPGLFPSCQKFVKSDSGTVGCAFKLAAWRTERCFLHVSRWSRYWGQMMKRGKDKWRATCEWSSPLGLRLFVWSMSSVTEPAVCMCVCGVCMRSMHMCILMLLMGFI